MPWPADCVIAPRGVGADGVELLTLTDKRRGTIRLHNADGSIAEISGNGTRCVAAWIAYETNAGPGDEIVLETDAGERVCRIDARTGPEFLVTSSMGTPVVQAHTLQVADGLAVEGAIVSTGNPHFVIFVDEPHFRVHGMTWEALGAQLCSHPFFPHQTNVEFVRVTGRDAIEIRIYERGVGPTSSSGTGTCATGSAAHPRFARRRAGVARDLTRRPPEGGMARWRYPADRPRRPDLLWRSLVNIPQLGQRTLTIPAVRRGSRVSVLSPASYPQPEKLARGVAELGRLGFLPSVGKQALAKAHHYFAGTTQARLDDLHAAFLDPAVGAIFCSRGGYGCNYLLPKLDLGLVREHPKPFIAHSDMTCIQTWMLDQVGLLSFHGPMVAGDFFPSGRCG